MSRGLTCASWWLTTTAAASSPRLSRRPSAARSSACSAPRTGPALASWPPPPGCRTPCLTARRTCRACWRAAACGSSRCARTASPKPPSARACTSGPAPRSARCWPAGRPWAGQRMTGGGSADPDAGVEQGVGHVHDDVRGDHEDGREQDETDDHRKVAGGDGLDRVRAEARQPENLLDHDDAAEQRADVDAEL